MTRVLIALGLALAAVAGCADRERTVPELSEQELDERVEALVRRSGPPLYWAGRSVAGLPLTDAIGAGSGGATFLYGTCRLPDGEGGCAAPIQIQQFPFVRRNWRDAAGCTRRRSIRGVPAVHHDTLVLFTGTRVVKIYAERPRRIALALRPLRGGRIGTPLPPPPPAIVREVGRACD
jgi:hypothetical protein